MIQAPANTDDRSNDVGEDMDDRAQKVSGSFHLVLPPGPGTTPNDLAKAFFACSRVRGIVHTVAFRKNVGDAYDTIFSDTCMACLPRLEQLDDPKNVYSMIWRTAENLALATWRELNRRDSSGVAENVDDLATAEADGHADDFLSALIERSPAEHHEDRAISKETLDARAAFRAKLLNSGFPSHIPQDLEQNLNGSRARRPRKRHTQPTGPVVPTAAVLELRSLRARLGLTVNEMALRCSVPPARMYSYLRGIVKSEEVMNNIIRAARELLPLEARNTVVVPEEK
ncbi:hypothetical protein [Burkholderia gladioli]|uniref:hypothetical protein n=1 Tax=Burkholderia gladioli TaxID=28095 RepID=UPI0011D22358|nr:hypothetical protein [Burkholderia gladioli]